MQYFHSSRDTVTNLDNSKLPMEKRGKLEKDAQIMIKMLPRQIEAEKKLKKLKKEVNDIIVHKLNKNVTFDYNDFEGRFARATSNIQVGDEILCQKAHCSTLFEMFSKTHCQNCFLR